MLTAFAILGIKLVCSKLTETFAALSELPTCNSSAHFCT